MDIFICDDNTLICNEINSLVSEFFRTNNMTMPVFHTFTDGKSLLSSNVRPDAGIVWYRCGEHITQQIS